MTDGLAKPIVICNCCRIACSSGDTLAFLPGEVKPPSIFATAIDANEQHEGRVIAIADSGFLGDVDTEYPGAGLIGHGDNKRFIRQCVEWLLDSG